MNRLYKFVVPIVLAALTIAMQAHAPAAAQGIGRCGLRAGVVAGLERRYQEEQTALGLTAKGNLIEVFVSPSGSWTIIQTSPQGMSCIMAAGSRWAQRTWPPREEGPAA
ncbi:MAG: hypothetical protein HC869_02060 [Rhodospirillales bacterium]|nr:hypothetical protein [Rhodospirillales bacterium]